MASLLPVSLLILVWRANVFVMSHSQDSPHNHPSQSQPGAQKSFHDNSVVHDAEHINEHLQGRINVNTSAMSPEELEFHYFQLHDFDSNAKLDGLELFKALTHLVPFDPTEYDEIDPILSQQIKGPGSGDAELKAKRKQHEMLYYTTMIDEVLRHDDFNGDGFLSYAEYVHARRREDAKPVREAEERKLGGGTY